MVQTQGYEARAGGRGQEKPHPVVVIFDRIACLDEELNYLDEHADCEAVLLPSGKVHVSSFTTSVPVGARIAYVELVGYGPGNAALVTWLVRYIDFVKEQGLEQISEAY